jgi:formylglycine-generating enzyme required for sulfatase activity
MKTASRPATSVLLGTLLGGLSTALAPSPIVAAEPAEKTIEEMDLVPAGEFVYGDDKGDLDERPARKLYLPAFLIDHHEVTAREYGRCVAAGRCAAPPSPASSTARGESARANLPVAAVSFHDAAAYCAFVGKRLPTEQEWEKAARGPTGRRFPWGDDFECGRGNFGNFGGDGRCAEDGAPGRPVAVGSFKSGASPYGPLDLAGNVWEWVDGRYDYAPLLRAEMGALRVLRGGGCCSIFGLPRASDRLALPAAYRDVDIGFRCARSAASSGPYPGGASR